MILDLSSIDLTSKQFGVGSAADVPFVIYREPKDDDIYMLYNEAFVIDETNLCEITKEGLTYDEALKEVLDMREQYMKDAFGIDDMPSEGDVYHTIDVNPDDNENNETPEEDIPEVDVAKVPMYEGTLLLNKTNYTLTCGHLNREDADKMMQFRGKLMDMASDWYGGVVESRVVLKDLMSIFEINNIKVDLSEWNAENDLDKMVSIMLLNALSYTDSIIIGIQRKLLSEENTNDE